MLDIRENYSLLPHNTFGIDVKARVFVAYESEEELLEALRQKAERYPQLPMLHIGSGSNLLFLSDYEGVILNSLIQGIEVLEENEHDVLVRVGAGMTCDDFIAESIRRGWYGMENLSLVPGQIGAAAVQNIGAYGVEFGDVVERVRGISLSDGKPHVWQHDECGYGYRQSVFKNELRGQYAITAVEVRLSRCFRPRLQYGGLQTAVSDVASLTPMQLRDIIIGIRRAKLPDPKELGNAGSFFMNPVVSQSLFESLRGRYPNMPYYPAPDGRIKLAAGWLIEQAGWKGRSLGPAAVHDRQALVLVNKGGARGEDIVTLSEAVRKAVYEQFGVEICPEVNFI